MLSIREAIAVEGKYDVVRLAAVVDTVIVPVHGFALFKNPEQMALLGRLAEARGLLVLTDSDSAGFVIRDAIAAAIPPERLKHAYIPEIVGKERRKTAPSKAGLLGVEGMDTATLEAVIRRSGATVLGEDTPPPAPFFTRTDLYDAGLMGAPDAAAKRAALCRALGLPQGLSTTRLLQVINTCLTPEALSEILYSQGDSRFDC